MSHNKTRIVAAVVDTRNLTLYKADGTTILIPQGDPRLRRILDEAIPQLKAQNWADVWIDIPGDNDYAKFEEKTNGLVKFFRVAKEKLKALFGGAEPVEPTQVGVVPSPEQAQVKEKDTADAIVEFIADNPNVESMIVETRNVVDEILQHAIPAAAPEFHEKSVAQQNNLVDANGKTNGRIQASNDAPDTVVAVVNGKIIPGMEKIKSQFTRAYKLGSTIGVENFLKRIAAVIDHRSHSVDDLLKFMERGDLPIADDGSILIYKVLRHKGDRTDGKYVDCHTGNVEQWTGAYVCMDEKLVDPNRRNECSNGLHVARRGYINGFSGDVCVMAKLAPEDVIAVPEYDANKMRVCGYHILFELTNNQYSLLKNNRPITEDVEGGKLLALALAGKHIHRTHEVRITRQSGGGVVVKELDRSGLPAEEVAQAQTALERDTEIGQPTYEKEEVKPAEALPDIVKHEKKDAPVEPKQVLKDVDAAPSRKEQAQRLYEAWQRAEGGNKQAALDMLVAFKKAAKVGWDKLGIPDPTGKAKPAAKPAAKKEPAKKAKAKPKSPPPKRSRAMPKVGEDVPYKVTPRKGDIGKSARKKAADQGSPRERIAKLMEIGLDASGIAQKIYDIKKASKKAWSLLGVSDDQAAKIMKAIGKGT